VSHDPASNEYDREDESQEPGAVVIVVTDHQRDPTGEEKQDGQAAVGDVVVRSAEPPTTS